MKMVRSRRGSIVQDIASKSSVSHGLPVYTDDLVQLLKDVGLNRELEPPHSNLELKNEKYKEYTDYLNQLEEKNGYYTTLRSTTRQVTDRLVTIIDKFQAISSETESFQNSIDSLATSLKESEESYETIQRELHYFQNLEPIARRLNQYSSQILS